MSKESHLWLLIDAGNSRIKWAWSGGEGLDSVGALDNQKIDPDLRGYWKAHAAPDRIWLANSGGEQCEEQIRQITEGLWGLSAQPVLSASHFETLTNGYHRADQLGVDRWLGLVAVWHHFQQPLCLVDCGTATTIDLVDHSGAHQGGVIFPGIGTSWEEFAKKVTHLEYSHGNSMQNMPGRSTREGLQVGVDGSIAAVERAISSILQHYGELLLLLTGGDAVEMEQRSDLPFQRVENAVLEGLLLVANSADSQ